MSAAPTVSPPLTPTTPDERGERRESLPARPRALVRWIRGGGLSTFLFFTPLLLTFGLFAWWPIVAAVPLSLQRTNFVSTEWVGFANFTRAFDDPLLATAALRPHETPGWGIDVDEIAAKRYPADLSRHDLWAARVRARDGGIIAP